MTWTWTKYTSNAIEAHSRYCDNKYDTAATIWHLILFTVHLDAYSNRLEAIYSGWDCMRAMHCIFSTHFTKSIFSLTSVMLLSRNYRYDSDFNHAPCLKNGHKAHWALIIGCLIDDNNQVRPLSLNTIPIISEKETIIQFLLLSTNKQ